MIYCTTHRDSVSVLDGNTHLIKATITHNFPPGKYYPGFFWNIAVNPNTNMIYTTNPFANTTTVIDGRTNQELKTISIGAEPLPIDINVKTNTAYILNRGDGTVSVITEAKR